MTTFSRSLKVTKTDNYKLDLSSWLAGESLLTVTATSLSGLVNVISASVYASSIGQGGVTIGGGATATLTGLTVGTDTIKFEYTTATRSDCFNANINVIADC